MIVSELIHHLKKYNPRAEVTCVDSETIELSYVDCDGKYDESTTPVVFVERRDYADD